MFWTDFVKLTDRDLHLPLDMSAESLLAGMKLVAEGTLVLFPLDGQITVMLLLVHSEV